MTSNFHKDESHARPHYWYQLITLVVLPLFLLCLVSFQVMEWLWKEQKVWKSVVDVVEHSKPVMMYLDALAKERGYTEGFIASDHTEFQQQMKEQRALVDQSYEKLLKHTQTHSNSIDEHTHQALQQLFHRHLMLREIRLNVDRLDAQDSFFESYSDVTGLALNTIQLSIDRINGTELARDLLHLLDLLWMKERAGQIRGRLNGVFASHYANVSQYSDVIWFQASYFDHLSRLEQNPNFKGKSALHQLIEIPVYQEVTAIEEATISTLHSAIHPENMTPGEWFEKATQRIGLIDALAVERMQDIEIRAEMHRAERRTGFYLSLMLLSGAIVCVAIYSYRTVKESQNFTHDLAQEVNSQTAELRLSNEQLKDAIDEMKASQQQLVEKDKLASLGLLMAGTFHEINTPVGIGITGITGLDNCIEELEQKFQNGSITKNDLEMGLNQVKECNQLVLNGLQRIEQLLTSFKLVVSDQAANEQRYVLLHEYIQDILNTLTPTLSKSGIHVELDIPENIALEINPGALYQVLSNLLLNSMCHAFKDIKERKIYLTARLEGDEVLIHYADNGKGLKTNVIEHVFEPFFTTERGKGGTGLGMYIVKTQLEEKLGGKISIDDDQSRGAAFTLTIPTNHLS